MRAPSPRSPGVPRPDFDDPHRHGDGMIVPDRRGLLKAICIFIKYTPECGFRIAPAGKATTKADPCSTRLRQIYLVLVIAA